MRFLIYLFLSFSFPHSHFSFKPAIISYVQAGSKKWEKNSITMFLSSLVIYDISVNVYRDITKTNKNLKEVAEITGVSGECL